MSDLRKNKGRAVGTSEMGATPPQAVDLEKGILGVAMLDATVMPKLQGILKASHFYREGHSEIYSAMLTLFEQRKPVDILTVVHELRQSGKLEAVGGAVYISKLTNEVASGAHVEEWAHIVAQMGMKREMIRIGSEIVKKGYDPTVDLFDMMEQAERDIRDSAGISVVGDSSAQGRALRFTKNLGMSMDSGTRGISWGNRSFDKYLGGLTPKLIFVGGRPGMGKSALMIWLAHQISPPGSKHRTVIMSVEMDEQSIAYREASLYSGVPYETLLHVKFTPEEFVRAQSAADKLAKSKVEVVEAYNLSGASLRAKLHNMKAKMKDIGCVMVDYLQLMEMKMSYQGESKASAVGNLTRELKLLSNELGVPIFALSQLSREVEKRGDKRPMMSDLKDSGSIEADADIILFPFRPEYYFGHDAQDENGNSMVGKTEIIVAKNRGGRTGSFIMQSDIACNRYYDLDFEPLQEQTQDTPF